MINKQISKEDVNNVRNVASDAAGQANPAFQADITNNATNNANNANIINNITSELNKVSPEFTTVPLEHKLERQLSMVANPVTLSWHDVNVYGKLRKGGFLCFGGRQKEERTVHILKNVGGQVKPGQLLAIMGASGAGKTTLINTLTARNLSKVSVKGIVRINGQPADVNTITALSAYVQQQDLFIGTLTVREHLVFQAQVRMDQSLSKKARMSRVEQVLVELGLAKCQNTTIGWPGTVKGISGGEMKRLAFASEVLTNPSIMFCDEPTSGLDSFMAQNVVSVLRDMAAQGRTIVCTIHQPSSEVFAMFDHLLLMADGRVAYLGKNQDAVGFFSGLGLNCPVNYNPADFFIQELAVVPGRENECKAKLNSICDRYEASEVAGHYLPKDKSGLYNSTHSFDESATKRQKLSMYKASWLTQFWALMWRSFLSVIREPMITAIRLVQMVVIALLLGAIYFGQKDDQASIMNINGALFLLLTNMTFSNAFAVINTFCIELPIFLREHNNGMYRVDTYFLTKMLAELPVFILAPVLFVGVYYYMVGLNGSADVFFMTCLIGVLVANCASSFGYFVSCISSNITMALSIGPPIMIPLLIFGGFFLNNDSTPVYFVWLKYLSWFYYGNEALMVNQWSNFGDLSCPDVKFTLPGRNGSEPTCLYKDGKAVLKNLNFDADRFGFDIVMLCVLLLAFRLLAYVALVVRARKR